MPHNSIPNHDLSWLSGGGQMGALIRSMDWSKTSLGGLETWPQSLKTSVSLCLSSTFPILICWGPDDIQIYNDSYRPICGDLHPKSMGMPFKVCWEAALPVVGDKFDRAHLGEGTYINNQRMFLERYGYLEEAWMTFSFSPIRDESGQIGGIFHPITETTTAMLSARRTQALRDFAAKLTTAKSVSEVVQMAGEDREKFELDLPFFSFYQVDAVHHRADRVGSSGLPGDSVLLTPQIDLKNKSKQSWPLGEITTLELNNLSQHFEVFQSGPYDRAPNTAMVLPVFPTGYSEPFGYLVAGLSSARALDDEYRNFFALLANTFSTAISNVLAYEQELKRAEALAQIDRAKTAFFSNVSHEFRTPLTLILGPLEDSLQDQIDPLSEKQRQRQEVTHRNALRLLKLVNSLLDFSRIEAGRVQAHYQPTDISQLTVDLASTFRSATDRAQLKLNIEADKLPEYIFIDRDMWEKIILNLISNAFKFTFEGSIDVKLIWTGNGVRLEVTDSGIGVPADELPKLFERFHRVQGAKGRSFEGTGIGLALVQELVKLHGGTISVQSTEGVGTTFSVEIPKGTAHLPADRLSQDHELTSTSISAIAFVEEAQRWLPELNSKKSEENNPQEIVNRKLKVLIADDNADMLSYVTSLLRGDYEVITAVDGLDALDKVQKLSPDLILSDVMMPRLDGFGLLKEIRSQSKINRTPIILLSARAGEEARLEGLNAGADDYMVKPFSARELVTRVASTLSIHRLREEQTQMLRENEERFRKMFSHAAVSIVLMDLTGHIIQVNDSFANALGYLKEEMMGKHFSLFTHPDDVASNLGTLEKIISGEISTASFEKRYFKRDGEIFYVQTSVSPYLDNDNKPIQLVAISQDISSRRLSEEQARLAKEEAERANASKSAFLANMSHEIRTPMTAVLGFTEVLRDQKMTEEERRNAIQRIDRSGRSLLRLIDDILDISKVEAGKIEISKSLFSPTELVEEVISLLSLSAEQKGIQLKSIMAPDVPDLMTSDIIRVRQILINLIGNAVKFTDQGHVTVLVSVDDQNKMVFEITDTGTGIALSDQHRLFKPFEQADASVTRRFGGTGLGLVLSKRLAEMLGGDIVLTWSELGKGSQFIATVDAAPLQFYTIASSPKKVKLVSTKIEPDALIGKRILVVEDVEDNQMLLRLYLESAGASVNVASNGIEAIEEIGLNPYDLVLMDVQMPVMDGLRATELLREKGFKKPILALTAHAMPEEIARSLKAGCDAHLIKPIIRSDLINSIVQHTTVN